MRASPASQSPSHSAQHSILAPTVSGGAVVFAGEDTHFEVPDLLVVVLVDRLDHALDGGDDHGERDDRPEVLPRADRAPHPAPLPLGYPLSHEDDLGGRPIG